MISKRYYSLTLLTLACLVSSLPLLSAQAQIQTSSDGASLGRLFYTPQRRAILNQMRERKIHISVDRQSNSMHLDGIVRRSDGRSTVWINGEAHQDAPPVASFDNNSAQIFSGKNKSVEIRVGETVELAPDSGSEKKQ